MHRHYLDHGAGEPHVCESGSRMSQGDYMVAGPFEGTGGLAHHPEGPTRHGIETHRAGARHESGVAEQRRTVAVICIL